MKKALLRKSIVATALLLVLAFSVTAINSSFARAGSKITIITAGEGTGEVTVTKEKSLYIVEIWPSGTNHISAIQVDAVYLSSFADNYYHIEFKVNEYHTITVYFDPEGTATVPAGTNVPVNLGDSVILYFSSTLGGGTATQNELDTIGTSTLLWEVSTEVSFDKVEITLPYPYSEWPAHLYRANSADELYSDVDKDGDVDGDDVSDIANAIKDINPQHPYNENYDVNRDGLLDQEDVNTANNYIGTELDELVPYVDFWLEDGALIILTEHLSVFRCF